MTDTNVFTVSEPGTFANPLTEGSCELPGILSASEARRVQVDHEQVPRSDAAAVRAVDGSYQAVRELIQRKFGKSLSTMQLYLKR